MEIPPGGSSIVEPRISLGQAETAWVSCRNAPTLRYDLPELTISLIAPETSRSMMAPPTTGSGKTENRSSGGRLDVTMIEHSARRSSESACRSSVSSRLYGLKAKSSSIRSPASRQRFVSICERLPERRSGARRSSNLCVLKTMTSRPRRAVSWPSAWAMCDVPIPGGHARTRLRCCSMNRLAAVGVWSKVIRHSPFGTPFALRILPEWRASYPWVVRLS